MPSLSVNDPVGCLVIKKDEEYMDAGEKEHNSLQPQERLKAAFSSMGSTDFISNDMSKEKVEIAKDLKAKIKAWERNFVSLYGRRPEKTDVHNDENIMELYKSYGKLKASQESNQLPKVAAANNTISKYPEIAYSKFETRMCQNSEVGKVTSTGLGAPKYAHLQNALANLAIRPPCASVSTGDAKKGVDHARLVAASSQDVSARTTSPAPSASSHSSSRRVIHPKITRVFVSPEQGADAQEDKSSKQAEAALLPEVKLAYTKCAIESVLSDDDDDDGKEESKEKTKSQSMVTWDLANSEEKADENGIGIGKSGVDSSLDSVLANEKPVAPINASDVFSSNHILPSSTSLSLYDVPQNGTSMRASVLRRRLATKPTTWYFTLKNDADDKIIACARRELNMKLRPVYHIFDHTVGAEGAKELARCRIKCNYEGSWFRIKDTSTGKFCALVQYRSASVPRVMRLAFRPDGNFTTFDELALSSGRMEKTINLTAGSDSHENLPPSNKPQGTLVLRNKLPKFSPSMKTYCLNFYGRVTEPSVKNFQLSDTDDGEVLMQFGRVGKDMFHLDLNTEIPVFVAFASALSTFDAIEKI